MPQHYNSRETLFAMPHPSDTLAHQLAPILTQLVQANPQATWLVPAGVGMHVDHLCVFAAAQAHLPTATLRYYEEVPYALDAEVIATRRAMLSPQLHTTPIGAYLAAKIAAVTCYASQMAALFGDPTTMPTQLSSYHQQIGADGPAERWYTC
jgi:LmbE family N-acetylglucosaminyl deacetylase